MKEQHLQSYCRLRYGVAPIALPTGQAGIGMNVVTTEGEGTTFIVLLPG